MKEFAIKENHLFVKAYQKGRKCVTGTLILYIMPDYRSAKLRKENPQKKYINRIGLTVSAKLGGAVARNRTKRILREAYRHINRAYKLKTGFLIVIVAREAAFNAKTGAVEKDLAYAFEKLGMII